METSQEIFLSVDRLVSRMKLPPLVESCEMMWPTKQEIDLILPSYEEDLLSLGALLGKHLVLLLEEVPENMMKLQTSLIACCYESTAFILSEEIGEIQQAIRDEYIWKQLMVRSDSKLTVSSLIAYYRKSLLKEDWFFQFGDLSSFWGFVWELMAVDSLQNFIDRETVDLIEQVCFKLMRSKSIQLFVKGVMILEECIYKTRSCSLVDYERVYEELLVNTWRMFETDERNQQISIVLVAALFECVKVMEVDRNQLLTVIQDFKRWSKTDVLMDLLLRALERSKSTNKSLALLEQIIVLLTVDHPNIQVTQLSSEELDECNNNNTENYALLIMDGNDLIDQTAPRWWKKVTQYTHGRFHRWTMKLLQMLVMEVGKIENRGTLHFQYLACILFFIIDCPGVDFKESSPETFINILQLMVSFLENGAQQLDQMREMAKETDVTYLSYVKFFVACIELIKEFAVTVIRKNSNLAAELNVSPDCIWNSPQFASLVAVSEKFQSW
ncbi:uncharacterized protein LOC131683865 [Topomyia yanbarensis]|uniref:uncharacterized protein LOC131683865 n=1 Tax=Topomyia yanbarensis TaxID=2498891 RepID=UPI00273C014F|nr:uncharacterized protein LOC131683865 [Topomyia yanbarensis]